MNIVVTGSLGNIGKPLTEELVQKGHSVMVISKAERKKDIEALDAKAAIGTMEDANFLIETFKGADIVYCMETLNTSGGFFNKNLDYIAAINKIGNNYKEAIHKSGVKHVVHLSSIGAHMDRGTAAQSSDILYEDYVRNKPVLGRMKIEDFAKEFAAAFK